jgi:hypothetical protein
VCWIYWDEGVEELDCNTVGTERDHPHLSKNAVFRGEGARSVVSERRSSAAPGEIVALTAARPGGGGFP